MRDFWDRVFHNSRNVPRELRVVGGLMILLGMAHIAMGLALIFK